MSQFAISRRRLLRNVGVIGAGGTGMAAVGMLGELARITAAAALSPLGTAHAQAADDYKALVCVFMFGGNDANNLLVPTDSGGYADYQRGRGVLALGRDALLPIQPANTGGRPFGLHPAMGGAQRLFQQGRLALLANVGPLVAPTSRVQYNNRSVPLPANLFSHSDQQSQWQSSQSDGSGRTGWAGRIGDLMQAQNANVGATCISLAGNNLWENGQQATSYKVSPSGNFGFGFYQPGATGDPWSAGVAQMLGQRRSQLFQQAWVDAMGKAVDSQRALSSAMSATPFSAVFPDTGLGNQLKMAARLIAARSALGMRRQTIFCSIGGFDTHGDDQMQRQQQLLGEVSDAIAAFHDATVQMGVADKATVFTASDFGRTFASNGKGSDHGWGSHHLVAGGAVRGGSLYGSFPTLVVDGPDDAGNGCWIPTSSVDQYAATLARWFGVAPADMATVLPNLTRFGSGDLGFMV